MRNKQTRKICFGVLLIIAIAALLIQPSSKSTAESNTRERKAAGQPAKKIAESAAKAGKTSGGQANTITDEVMSVSAPTAMSPEQLPKPTQVQTLQYREDEEEEGAILSDIEPARLLELKNQTAASQFLVPEWAPDGYSAETDSSTSSLGKSLLEPLTPNSFVNFEGPDNLSQLDGFLHRPPDGGMAAGPNHVVVSVNSLVAIYSKSGTRLLSASLASWFTNVCSGCSPFDPRVVYDPTAGRWILIAVHKTASVSTYLVAVSQTSDPTGSWWLYPLNGALIYTPTGENTWADFPHLGFDGIASASGGAIYITSNQFTFGSDSFRTSILNILPKSALYSGATFNYWRASGRTNADASQAFTLSPAATYGNPGGEFLINTKNANSFVTLWKVIPTYPPTAVNWTLQSTNAIGAYTLQPDASQPGSCALMATNDNRISSNSVWRNNQIYAAFTEGHNWGGGNVAAIRFIQINTSTNATAQNLTYGADGLSYFFPSLSADASDNVVLTFARVGSSEFGSARYTGRLATEPVNTLQGSAQLKGGAECITGGRWGDYSAAALDPADTGKVWIFGLWAKDLPGVTSDWDWGIWIGQVGFGSGTGSSAWTDTDIGVGTDNKIRSLWNNMDGSVALWVVAPDGAFQATTYGPYSGWTAKAIAAGADNLMRVLWTNTNGSASLWVVAANGGFQANVYGPYAGWTAADIGVGADNQRRVLWTNTNGSIAVWVVAANGGFQALTYGPYAGWTARRIAAGADSKSRVLWTNSDGSVALWTINADGTFQASVYGPYSGWTGADIGVGSDNKTRVLWNHSNGSVALWTVQLNGATQVNTYGPYAGWTAKSIAVGSDNQTRVLWNNTNGSAAQWVVASNGSFQSNLYGPY